MTYLREETIELMRCFANMTVDELLAGTGETAPDKEKTSGHDMVNIDKSLRGRSWNSQVLLTETGEVSISREGMGNPTDVNPSPSVGGTEPDNEELSSHADRRGRSECDGDHYHSRDSKKKHKSKRRSKQCLSESDSSAPANTARLIEQYSSPIQYSAKNVPSLLSSLL